jgi:hypothetical protein
VPIAPCARHTQWRSGTSQLRSGTSRRAEKASAAMGVGVTVLRTAYIDVARLHGPIATARRRTGREQTLLVRPDDYTAAEHLEPRREMWRNYPG